jgi:hypothetical protein
MLSASELAESRAPRKVEEPATVMLAQYDFVWEMTDCRVLIFDDRSEQRQVKELHN